MLRRNQGLLGFRVSPLRPTTPKIRATTLVISDLAFQFGAPRNYEHLRTMYTTRKSLCIKQLFAL